MDRFAHYVWPFFDPPHARLAREADTWAAANLDYAHGDDTDAICRRLVRELGAAGFLRHCAPGGDEFDVRSIALLREVLAYHSGLADFAFAMQGLGSVPIGVAGTSEQKERYLPKVAAGETIAAFALSEPEAGSDAAALSAEARRDGDGWVLDGVKSWISNGGIAGFYVVFARSEPGAGAKGVSAFIVEAAAPGLDCTERIDVSAPHPMAVVKLSRCRVPAQALLGQPGEGFKLAMRCLDIFRTTVAAAALGFARRALDESLGRARERRLFGRTLADMQLTQAKLADMATGIEAGALLAYRASWQRDVGRKKVTREVAMAKMQATETAQRVVDEAVQIFGGLGVMRGHPVERLYREVRALRIYEGATEVQKLIIARELLEGDEGAKD